MAQVIYEPYRALAPAHGADVTVVARWALDSLRRIARRDAILTITLITGAFFSWLFAAVVKTSPWVVFFTVVAMFGLAFFCIAYEHWVRWYGILAGQMLRDGFDPERAPEPTSERAYLRLQAAADRKSGNLVVFGGRSAFIGSGNRLGQEQIVIDVSCGKEKDDNSSSEPIPFTNTDVHLALTQAIGNLKLPGLNVMERVFVNGKHVRGNGELQRQPLEPPFASVSDELLHGAAEQPTADARAYVCAEIRGWQGQLVVTCFLPLTLCIRESISCTMNRWPTGCVKLRRGVSPGPSRICCGRRILWLNRPLKSVCGMRMNPHKDISSTVVSLLITARCEASESKPAGAAIAIISLIEI